jgi:GTP-binding protein of the ras superfamily involved in termination of M-phase
VGLFDLGGDRAFLPLLPLVVEGAAACVFAFDLTRAAETLASVKEYFKQARGLNPALTPVLVGTKFDAFLAAPPDAQAATVAAARRYARAMRAPLVFTSATAGVNVHRLVRLVLERVFRLPRTLAPASRPGEPLLEYCDEPEGPAAAAAAAAGGGAQPATTTTKQRE